MKMTVTGRHMTVTPALRRYLEQRAQRLDRYGARLDNGQFVLSVEKYRHAAEGVVAVDGRIIQGKVATREMYASIDRLLEKLERQLVKGKEKRAARKLRKRSSSGSRGAAAFPASEPMPAVTRVSAPAMTQEEALNRMEARRSPFLIFQDVATGRLQAVQRTDGGRLELIDAGFPSFAE
jgi:putative sigma-54 modulation protein